MLYVGSPLLLEVQQTSFYTPALLLQDFAYSYRVWMTLIKLLNAPIRYLKFDPDIHLAE